MPFVSVAMATYNGEKYIHEQIDSILSQSIVPNQIMIIDDCSNDSTWSILTNYKKNNEELFSIFRNETNMGIIETFKRCLNRCTGDYVFLCDQDDIWENNKIEICLEIALKYDAEVIATGIQLVNASSERIVETDKFRSDPICGYGNWTNSIYCVPLEKLIWGNFSPGCTYCVSKRIIPSYLSVNNNEILHDYQLFMIAANRGKAIYYDAPLMFYRLHSTNAVGMNNKEKKRKRHIRPRLIRFLGKYSLSDQIRKKKYIWFVLYLRLPKIKSVIIHVFRMKNDMRSRLKLITQDTNKRFIG